MAVQVLGLQVKILLGACMSVCVLSVIGLCEGLIIHPEEPYKNE
jgi:hypothetical protein